MGLCAHSGRIKKKSRRALDEFVGPGQQTSGFHLVFELLLIAKSHGEVLTIRQADFAQPLPGGCRYAERISELDHLGVERRITVS